MKCPRCGSNCSLDSVFCSHCGFELGTAGAMNNTDRYILKPESFFHIDSEGLFAERYRIEEEIGRGGMGRVYRAFDTKLDTVVALKMIRPEFLEDQVMIRRFKKEILLAREISHPNVVRIHDFSEYEGVKFISMQYVDGESLRKIIRDSGALNIDAVVSIATQILEGLVQAHSHGILHRDLKPHNIMIDQDGNAILTDFGLAKFIGTNEATRSKTLMGTPQYISPEQWKGNSLNRSSDLYSLGIIMFEMLSGRLPFTADSDFNFMHKHVNEKPRFSEEEQEKTPQFLRKIILRCLEKNPSDRYQNADEVLKDLQEGSYSSIPIHTRLLGTVKRKITCAVALLVVMLFLFLIFQPYSLVRSEKTAVKRQHLAVLKFRNETGDTGLNRWQSALPNLLVTDLAQSKYFRVLSDSNMNQLLSEMKVADSQSLSAGEIKKLAARSGVNYFIQGSYARAGDLFRVNLWIVDAKNGDLAFTDNVEGRGEQCFFPLVDQLTRRIKAGFGISPRELMLDIDQEIGKISTSSPEALKQFVLARNFYFQGKYDRSNQALLRALKHDHDFALAYRSLAVNYNYLEDWDKSRMYLQKALDLIERVSWREQQMIRGFSACFVEQDFTKAAEIYQKLIEVYPEDEDGNLYLGAMLRNLHQWSRAEQCFRNVLRVNPRNKLGLENLIYICRNLGMYTKAEDLLRKHKVMIDDSGFISYWTSINLTCQSRYESALITAREAIAADPGNVTYMVNEGNILQLMGDTAGAEACYLKLSREKNIYYRTRGMIWLFYLYLEQGKFSQAGNILTDSMNISSELGLKENRELVMTVRCYFSLAMGALQNVLSDCDKLEEEFRDQYNQDKPRLLNLKGVALCGIKKAHDAEKISRKLEKLPVSYFGKTGVMYYHHLQSALARENGNFPGAYRHLNQALEKMDYQSGRFDCQAYFIFDLAELFRKEQKWKDAIVQYRRLTNLSFGRLTFGNLYALSHFYLAQCYTRIGWEGKALEYYRLFLDIWEDADQMFPQIKSAHKEIQRLSSL